MLLSMAKLIMSPFFLLFIYCMSSTTIEIQQNGDFKGIVVSDFSVELYPVLLLAS